MSQVCWPALLAKALPVQRGQESEPNREVAEPGSHSVHAVAAGEREKEPGGHGTHDWFAERANVPGAQTSQAPACSLGATEPGAHCEQDEAASREYEPATQG
jgi:hypothetical protein